MLRFELLVKEHAQELYVDVLFLEPLPSHRLADVLQVVIQLTHGKVLVHLDLHLVGIASLKIDEQGLSICFQFERVDAMPGYDQEDYVRRRVHFLCYFFAVVDRQHPLGEVPFPESFREWLHIADEYGIDMRDDDR